MPELSTNTPPAQRPALASWLQASVGLIAWLAAYFLFEPSWELAILWMGALVYVPLAFGLALRGLPSHYRFSLSLPFALLLVLSFEFQAGWLALPWLMFCVAWAGFGAWRLFTQGLRRAEALADWGLVLLAVSGAWTFAAALEWKVFGYSLIWLQLTAIHQMFAGLVLQVLAACIVARRPGRIPIVAGVAVSLGNPLVALGISATHAGMSTLIELAAVWVYAPAVIVLGWMQLYLALSPKSGLPVISRILLVLSDLSLGTAMTLALIYVWGVQRGYPTMTIPEMITWHGTLNAVGFGLCGLVGWTLAEWQALPARE